MFALQPELHPEGPAAGSISEPTGNDFRAGAPAARGSEPASSVPPTAPLLPSEPQKLVCLQQLRETAGGVKEALKALRAIPIGTMYTVMINPRVEALTEWDRAVLEMVLHDAMKTLHGKALKMFNGQVFTLRRNKSQTGPKVQLQHIVHHYSSRAPADPKTVKRRTQAFKNAAVLHLGDNPLVRDAILRRLSATDRSNLLGSLSGLTPIKKLNAESELSVYIQIGLNQWQIRALRSAFKGFGVVGLSTRTELDAVRKNKVDDGLYTTGMVELYPQGVKVRSDVILRGRGAEYNHLLKRFPFLSVVDLPAFIAKSVMDLDRTGDFVLHPYQSKDEYVLLWGGDKGGKSTKFGFINTHQMSANSGKNFQLVHMFDTAPDSYHNLMRTLGTTVEPSMRALFHSSIVRIQMGDGNNKQCGAAVVPTSLTSLFPTPFAVLSGGASQL